MDLRRGHAFSYKCQGKCGRGLPTSTYPEEPGGGEALGGARSGDDPPLDAPPTCRILSAEVHKKTTDDLREDHEDRREANEDLVEAGEVRPMATEIDAR